MKLTIEHLAPYLPYGLEFIDSEGRLHEMVGLNISEIHLMYEGQFGRMRIETETDLKPILRPLSDIKDITDEILFEEFAARRMRLGQMYYDNSQLLVKKHFDVFGLIEAGLAIDMNTLNNLTDTEQ